MNLEMFHAIMTRHAYKVRCEEARQTFTFVGIISVFLLGVTFLAGIH